MNQSLTHCRRGRPIHVLFLGPQLLHLLSGLVPIQITWIFQMLVLRTSVSQLVLSSLDKGTAGRGRA